MSIVVYEKWNSRTALLGEQPSITLNFGVRGTADDGLAKAVLATYAPLTYHGLVRQSLRVERVGQDVWEGEVQYGPRKPPETHDSTYQFETSGGTQRITQSLKTVGRYAPPGQTAPDYKGAIGVTHDSVEGVDITIPVYTFSETHYIPTEEVTGQYKAKLFWLTGTVNEKTFRGFEAGEVLFLGASGSKRTEEHWEISFRFAASPNVKGLKIGDIEGINKKGWEYLWVRYADRTDNNAKALVKRPVAVYVEQVYREADFEDLGIGT